MLVGPAGRWKPLAYSIKRMFTPLQVQAFQDGSRVKVFLVNDRVTPVMTTVYVSLLSLEQNDASCESARRHTFSAGAAPVLKQDYEVQPGFASEVWSTPLLTLLRSRPNCTTTTCYVSVTAVAKPNQPGAGDISETQLWLVPLKDIDLPDPQLSVSDFQLVTDEAAIVGTASLPRRPRGARTLLAKEKQADEHTHGHGRKYRSHIVSGGGLHSSNPPAPTTKPKWQETVHAGPILPPLGEESAPDNASAPIKDTVSKPVPAPVAPSPPKPAPKPGTPISFTLSSTRPAALTNLLTSYRGRFSDDVFTAFTPCSPKKITFYPHVSAGSITAEDFAADLQVESLFTHQYGKPVPSTAKGGAAAIASTQASKLSKTSTAALRNRPN